MTITRTSLTVTYPQQGASHTFRYADLGWTSGIVQFGHHSYNPTKDGLNGGEGAPNTWHWDNIAINPARPFYQRQASPERSAADSGTITLAEPAPAGAVLKLGAVCDIELNVAGPGRPHNTHPEAKSNPGYPANIRHPIPAGTTHVDWRGLDGQRNCVMSNPIIAAR